MIGTCLFDNQLVGKIRFNLLRIFFICNLLVGAYNLEKELELKERNLNSRLTFLGIDNCGYISLNSCCISESVLFTESICSISAASARAASFDVPTSSRCRARGMRWAVFEVKS